ncbi:hypothetical protein Dimus_023237 [Dionaea muscipula]
MVQDEPQDLQQPQQEEQPHQRHQEEHQEKQKEQEKQPKEEEQQRQGIPEHLTYKSQLVIYAQRAHLPLPAYQSINEAPSYEPPKFRCSVLVDGVSYTSSNTFSHVRAAEQDAARHALEAIMIKLRDEGCALIREDKLFCKSILNEFAVKTNTKLPSYTTEQTEVLLPMFTSSLIFNGVKYTGEAARNKKEAEQLTAKSVLLSILGAGNSESEMVLLEIIKSKARLYALAQKSKDSLSVTSIVPVESTLGSEFCTPKADDNVIVAPVESTLGGEFSTPKADVNAISEGNGASNEPANAISVVSDGQESDRSVVHLNSHEVSNQKGEPASEVVELPITCDNNVIQVLLASDDQASQKKRIRRSRKKANKRARKDAQLQEPTTPANQVSPCAPSLNQVSA